MPAAAPQRFSVNRISVLFNWQNFNFCIFFPVFLMKIAAARFQICISIDFYSMEACLKSDKIGHATIASLAIVLYLNSNEYTHESKHV